MARALVVLAVILGTVIGARIVLISPAADAQDRTEERLNALETRVAEQDARIQALEDRPEGPGRAPTAAGAATPPSPVYTITGDYRLRLDIDGESLLGGSCTGWGVYRDIKEGTPIIVNSGSGQIIGYGQLGAGVVVTADTEPATNVLHCLFPLEIASLPKADRYVIQVGTRTRETFMFSRLESEGWQVHLSLGN